MSVCDVVEESAGRRDDMGTFMYVQLVGAANTEPQAP